MKTAALLVLLALLLCPPGGAGEWETEQKRFDIESLPGMERREILDQPPESTVAAAPLPAAINAAARTESPDLAFMREQVISERWYIFALCLLSFVSLITVLLFLKVTPHSARDIVNASGLNLIIFGTIILVMIVDTSEQLTAAIGVLAAIAGYLFGTMQKKA